MKEINLDKDSEWLSLKELFNANLKSLPENFKTLQRLAKKENWKNRIRKSGTRGVKGYEYHISSLPLEARVDLLDRLASVNKNDVSNVPNRNKKEAQLDIVTYIEQQEQVASALSKAEHFGSEIDKRNLSKAKEQLLLGLIAYRGYLGIKGRECFVMQMYVDKYNRGELNIAELIVKQSQTESNLQGNISNTRDLLSNQELYQYIPSLSNKSLWRWKKAYKDEGFNGLLENWETKGRKCIMDNPIYMAPVLKCLKERTHASNRMIYEFLLHELQGEIPLSYRGFSRWFGDYKAKHRQEIELLTNPDGWKNKYKLSLGRADENIVRLNQRWEIDSTKADIMLNDNTRCNIVGIKQGKATSFNPRR